LRYCLVEFIRSRFRCGVFRDVDVAPFEIQSYRGQVKWEDLPRIWRIFRDVGVCFHVLVYLTGSILEFFWPLGK
jgi:hypothetical protein